MAKDYDTWLQENMARKKLASEIASGGVVDQSGDVAQGVGQENLTQNQNVTGLPGSASTAASLSPNVAVQGGKLLLDTLDKAYAAKNAQNMLKYQQRLAEFNKNQNILQRMASSGMRV